MTSDELSVESSLGTSETSHSLCHFPDRALLPKLKLIHISIPKQSFYVEFVKSIAAVMLKPVHHNLDIYPNQPKYSSEIFMPSFLWNL